MAAPGKNESGVEPPTWRPNTIWVLSAWDGGSTGSGGSGSGVVSVTVMPARLKRVVAPAERLPALIAPTAMRATVMSPTAREAAPKRASLAQVPLPTEGDVPVSVVGRAVMAAPSRVKVWVLVAPVPSRIQVIAEGMPSSVQVAEVALAPRS